MKKYNLFILASILIIVGILLISRSKMNICYTETVFFTNSDTIVSKEYYRNLTGDWVLLDKNKILIDETIKLMEISSKNH